MQRLFSMFPQGGPGLALLLLRISVALFLVSAAQHSGVASNNLVLGLSLLVAALLTTGFMTPYLSALACACAIANVVLAPHTLTVVGVCAVLDAAALGFLGPGAYSVDARLFGRKVTVVPPRMDRNREI